MLGAVPTDLVSVADPAQYREVEQIRTEISAMRQRLPQASDADAAQMQAELAAKERDYKQKLREIQARGQSGNNDLYQNVVGEYVRATADYKSASAPVEYWRSEAERVRRRISEMETANQAILDATRDDSVAENTYIALRKKLEDATVIDRLNAENITRISLMKNPRRFRSRRARASSHPARRICRVERARRGDGRAEGEPQRARLPARPHRGRDRPARARLLRLDGDPAAQPAAQPGDLH